MKSVIYFIIGLIVCRTLLPEKVDLIVAATEESAFTDCELVFGSFRACPVTRGGGESRDFACKYHLHQNLSLITWFS